MGSFIVSARKYRPNSFGNVIGQSTITRTLINAISDNHLAQSFLFCGPRGVGKTTCARILAKVINCQNRTKNIESCDKCESCISFNESHSFNIHELDAASNNSVDDIRNLVEQVRFSPQVGDYNIYIIDEVHMLSASAFNAFLKTLEEPPKHAIFILATTEKHKIIPTILSRCQIFDFKRIKIEDIVTHLEFVAKEENIKNERKALQIIAEKSDGSLRDSLSIFDRLASFSNGITYNSVIEALNILDYDYYFKITDSILDKDISKSLLIFNEIIESGFDGNHFIIGLAEHFRNLLVAKDIDTHILIEKGDYIKNLYINQSDNCEEGFLFKALEICNKCDIQYRATKNQQLLVELGLMKICNINFDIAKKKVSDLETINNREETVGKVNIDEDNNKLDVKNTQEVEKKILDRDVDNTDDELISNHTNLISISDLDDIEEIDKDKSIKKRHSSFNDKDLQKVWIEYINEMRIKGKSNFATTLDMYKPIILEENIIEVLISNKSQEVVIEKERIHLHQYIRHSLENDFIEIKTRINEIDKKEQIPYTNKDKYEQLSEINPNLKELKKKLGLDFDF